MNQPTELSMLLERWRDREGEGEGEERRGEVAQRYRSGLESRQGGTAVDASLEVMFELLARAEGACSLPRLQYCSY